MTPLPRLYLTNLVALVTTGVLASGWLLYYTESFEVVGGLLGLGGLFAWAAFVVGLLKDDSKEKLQTLFEDSILLRWRTIFACAAIVIGLVALTSISGTLVLDAEAETTDRMVSVSTGESGSSASSRLPARSIRRLWFLTPFGGTTLRVKIDGLPGIDAELRPPFPTRLGVPASFEGRPLLLVRTGSLQSGSFARTPTDYLLHVRLAGKTAVLQPYGGQSVWIGTEDDVPVPAGLLQRWRESLTIAAVSAAAGDEASVTARLSAVELVLARWATPRAVWPEATLHAGQEVTVEVHRVTDKYVLAKSTVVVRPAAAGDAIQEVILE